MSNATLPFPAPTLENEASFRLLFHQHPLPMWVVDNETLAFLAVNDAAVDLYGFSRDEFYQLTMDQIADPDQSAVEPDRQNEATGPAPTTPWRHRRKDGTYLRVESTWHEIPFGGREAVLVLTIDRTEQFRAEQSSREQARLLDLASDAIVVRDLRHRVVYWNRGAERLYGWTAAEVRGQLVTELFFRRHRGLSHCPSGAAGDGRMERTVHPRFERRSQNRGQQPVDARPER